MECARSGGGLRAIERTALARLELIEADIGVFDPAEDSFDLTAILGGGGIPGGIGESPGAWHAGLVEAAHVLIGEGFWVRPPARDYLALLESSEEEFRDHRGNVQAGIDAGLVPLHAAVSSADEWDEYEWKYSRAIERYAQERPDDPEVPEILARIRRWRDGYLRWGRDTLGLPRICSSVLSRTAQGWAKAGSARDCWACQCGMWPSYTSPLHGEGARREAHASDAPVPIAALARSNAS